MYLKVYTFAVPRLFCSTLSLHSSSGDARAGQSPKSMMPSGVSCYRHNRPVVQWILDLAVDSIRSDLAHCLFRSPV